MTVRPTLTLEHELVAGRTGKGVSVAVVDSGVHATHPHIVAGLQGFGVREDGTKTQDYIDRLGHGTAVTAAIMEKAPGADYQIVKVFNTRLSTSSRHLVHAVRKAVATGARLINLSLATTDSDVRDTWVYVVHEAVAAGAIIVTARDRRLGNLYPGELGGTIGVVVNPRCPRGEIRLGPGERPIIGASGYPRPIPNVPTERNLAGVSFAIANTTGFLARVLEGRPEISSAEAVIKVMRSLAEPRPQRDVFHS